LFDGMICEGNGWFLVLEQLDAAAARNLDAGRSEYSEF
jgi:hypothetical protein